VGIFIGVVILFGLGFLIWGIWQILAFWGDRLKLKKLHPIARTYTQMLQQLSEQGMPKLRHQTPQEYADQVRDKVSAEQADVINAITQVYQDWYYGDRSISAGFLTRMLQTLRRLKFR
jgi:Domain of unknown function (DUF4129)